MYKTLPRFDPGTSRVGILYATTELPMLTTNRIVKNFYLKTLQFCDLTVVENLNSKLKNLEVGCLIFS